MPSVPTIRTTLRLMFPVAMMLSLAGPLIAQNSTAVPEENGPDSRPQARGPVDPVELEAFLDRLLEEQMEGHHIAGAAISVVKDGRLFFAKGYGSANLEKHIPVDAEQTVFRIGSVGKLFTWTAVMQLVDQGRLDLNAPIQTYLDFRIPDTYPQPITLKHLMTHTSGFEDRLHGSVVSEPADLIPVREWLMSHMSARVRPPGDCAAYSNYNAMLAGYIVARASGLPYDRYIQEHILDPLRMVHSTSRSPIPPDLRELASVGYTYKDGAFQEFPDYIAQPATLPSGAHQASVTDMARFMIAHLESGRYADATTPDARILSASTARQMHSTLYTPDPRLLGTAHGFFDLSDNGQRTIGHSGYSPPMYSLMLLLPAENLGLFVVYNSEGGGDLVNQHLGFQRAFFDHYFPAPRIRRMPRPADFARRAGRFEGSYRATQGSRTTIDKVGALFGAVRLSHPGDGTLRMTSPWGEWRFVEVEPLYFRQVDGPFGLAFREDHRGRITRAFTDLTPQFAFEKLRWYETPGFNMALLAGCVLTFLSMIPVVLIRLIQDARRGGSAQPAGRRARAAQWILTAICCLDLLFLAGTLLWGMPPSILHDFSWISRAVLGLGVVSAVLTAGALTCAVLAWKSGYWGIAARTYYTLVTIAAVGFVCFLTYWNLLGWRF